MKLYSRTWRVFASFIFFASLFYPMRAVSEKVQEPTKIRQRHKVTKSQVRRPSSSSGSKKTGFGYKAYSLAVGLVPNTLGFTAGFAQTVEALPNPGSHFIAHAKNKYKVNAMLSNWYVTSIVPPSEFNRWDISFSLKTLIKLTQIEKTMPIQVSVDDFQTATNETYDYSATYALIVAAATPTFYTPIGSFLAGVGYGPGYHVYRDNRGAAHRGWSGFWGVNLGYTFFFTSNFFIQVSEEFYYTPKPHISVPTLNVKKWTEGAISIGYYFPWIRPALLGLW